MTDAATLERFAHLAVSTGANVQRGQIVSLGTEPGKEEVTRALATAAYRAGARFVDVTSFDLHVKRARLLHADPDTLDFVPSWYGERMLALGDQRAARISLSGPVAPGLLADVDPERAGRDQLPMLREAMTIVNDRTVNWTILPCPTPAWAALVHPSLDPVDALARLWEQVEHVCRLDQPDPAQAWEERMSTLEVAARELERRRFDALHFEGPGTDLHVGLLPGSLWLAARMETVEGVVHIPNLPTEEIFSAPDPERVEGVVRATKPLVIDGSVVRDLRVRFEAGRAVEITASEGAEMLRARCARDDGAARLGEVALVDREGRIGALDTVFFDTLLDENQASHLAFGSAYEATIDDDHRGRGNQSAIHVDFMVGSPEVRVTGVAVGGERVPVLRDGAWAL